MNNTPVRSVARRPAAAGFTLLELIISVAIIMVLVGLALVALRGAKRGADRAVTLNALRQIMTGYSSYSTEHKGRLLPGYIKPANLPGTGAFDPLTQLEIRPKLPGGALLNDQDASGFVWRLAPYMNNGYAAMLSDYTAGLQKRYENEYSGGVYGPGTIGGTELGIGLTPSIGYNSIYLGGDNFHGDGNVPDYSPWGSPNPNVAQPTIAATRVSDVQYPTQTIVFAACKAVNMTLPDAGEQLGYVELRPPWLPGANPGLCDQPQWVLDSDNQLQPNAANFSGPGGLMVDRNGGNKGDSVPTAHMDGSVLAVNPLSMFEDSSLGGVAQQVARDRIIAQWSPAYAKATGAP